MNYIEEKIHTKKSGSFRSNVVNNIFAEFADGFLVKGIHFAEVEVEFVVKGDRDSLEDVRNRLKGIFVYPFGEMLKIITYSEEDEALVRDLLDNSEV